jgi:hypothetical protein
MPKGRGQSAICLPGAHPAARLSAGMSLIRAFFGVLLFLAPVMPGFFQLSLAERCEEHQEAAQAGQVAVEVARPRVGQRPPPSQARRLRTAQRAKRLHAFALCTAPTEPVRARRAVRRVLYGGGDDDPDPDASARA